MVAVRLRRQDILSDPDKEVQIVMLEAALYTRLCTPATMAGQLDRLLAADGLPALELTVVPFTAQVPVYPLSGFVIYDDQLVLVETLTGEQQLNDPEEITRYIGWFVLLRDAAAGKQPHSSAAPLPPWQPTAARQSHQSMDAHS